MKKYDNPSNYLKNVDFSVRHFVGVYNLQKIRAYLNLNKGIIVMRLNGRVFVIVPILVMLASCSNKDESRGAAEPSETRESMLNLVETSHEACPSLTGTYSCKVNRKDAALEPMNLILRESKKLQYHLSYIDTENVDEKSFLDRQIEKLIFDKGGFNVNGKIEDQTTLVKGIAAMFIDPRYLSSFRMAYVGSCNSRQLKLHYVTGQTAYKSFIKLNDNKSITQTMYQLTEDGQVKKESGTCLRVSESHGGDAPANPATDKEDAKPKVYPDHLLVELLDANRPTDKEPIYIRFNQHGRIFAKHIYSFNESYMGPTNDWAFLWWGQGDDVNWSTPWKIVSIDFDSLIVYGGGEAGSGAPFGNLQQKDGKYYLEILISHKIDYSTQNVTLIEIPKPQAQECPMAIAIIGQCPLFTGVFDTLTAIDFGAMGEVAPEVAGDVASIGTVVKLTKSIFLFNGSVDSIRDGYLIPALKAIGQLKALKKVDKNNRKVYLQKTQEAYSNIIVTSIDTAVKTQKLIPDALKMDMKTPFGLLLSYLGASKPGEKLSGQPSWVAELVVPVAMAFADVTLDLFLNTSNTSWEARMDRFIALETQLRKTVKKLCDSSPTNAQSECTAALNQ